MQRDWRFRKKLKSGENLTRTPRRLTSAKRYKPNILMGVSLLALPACGGNSSDRSIKLITGTAGADRFSNYFNDERFEGGLGNDIYQLNYGGSDEIFDIGGIDEILIPFDERNNHTRKNLERIGDNLVITQIDGSSTTILYQFYGNFAIEYLNYHVDGRSIGRERIGSLDVRSISENEFNILVGSDADQTFYYYGSEILSIWTGDGNDTIVMGSANDCIRAGDGNDVIHAGSGNDQVFAGSGDDTIQGGDGSDTLCGGSGADIFIFNQNESGTDIIVDFSLFEGDKLDLSSYGIRTEIAAEVLMSDVSAGVNIKIDGGVILVINGLTVDMFTAVDGWLVSARDTDQSSPSFHFAFSTDSGSYVLVAEAKSYSEAANYARSELNGTLASFEEQSEFDMFFSALQATVLNNGLSLTSALDGGGAEYIWLGGTDSITEGIWIWDSGIELFYDGFWGSGELGSEPDDYFDQDGLAIGMENWPAGSESGEGFGNAGSWNDIDVSNSLYFVVEVG